MRKLIVAAIAAWMITACSGGVGGNTDYVPFDAPPISDELKQEFVKAVNDARAVGRSCGHYGYFKPAPPLKWDDRLYRAAYEHSEDMAVGNMDVDGDGSGISHTGTGTENDWTAQVLNLGRGSKPPERVSNNGFSSRFGGENIAAGYFSTNDVIDAWLSSDGHCSNIMDGEITHIGMAYVENNDSEYGWYWTQDFGIEK